MFKKEFEKYKFQLQEKATLLKTSLSIYAEEQNIANQRIDNQKSGAIHQVYSGICNVARPITRIIAGSPFVSSNDEDHISFYREKAEQAHAASGVLSSLLVNHAIYFDEPTYKQIADFSSESAFAVADFLRVIRKNDAALIQTSELLEKIEKEKVNITVIYQERLKTKQYELIKKFRNLLGIAR